MLALRRGALFAHDGFVFHESAQLFLRRGLYVSLVV
jgi:hypothetical protein